LHMQPVCGRLFAIGVFWGGAGLVSLVVGLSSTEAHLNVSRKAVTAFRTGSVCCARNS